MRLYSSSGSFFGKFSAFISKFNYLGILLFLNNIVSTNVPRILQDFLRLFLIRKMHYSFTDVLLVEDVRSITVL